MAAAAPLPVLSGWQNLTAEGAVPLRCWWARPEGRAPRAAVVVLPEVFGLNSWVRSVADRLAAAGYAALALPIFARTAPDLDVSYDEAGLAAGRLHRDQVTAADSLADAGRAIAWLQAQPGLEQRPVGCVGFCFGGHLALLVASLDGVAATCDFYGARVSVFRPGGGPPSLEVVPRIPGHLLCFCGAEDPLMPPEEQQAIAAALEADGRRHPERLRRLVVAPGAGHGYMCEHRGDFAPEAAAEGWRQMLELFAERLG
ncbi:dienelactone hydrolase [Cyanobium sp. PCC 7001]|uniref:dienelactone hydrolase family protein n=1 Tax=Cyanobium sp. PCC 7001 TaxID=180281 RepID=UPI00018051BD|nr:dienelactone hydrolase family protein [Cyanobium sp. PCC 7001]EDY38287.1 dienelactone hydrolase [Cyanobium sp. PCC 7001]